MDATDFLSEKKFTTNELAENAGLHPNTIRKLFLDEPGVVRIGRPARGRHRQYFKLLIPTSVAQRVFQRMTVGIGS
jgi:hypothetical protein